MRHPSRYVPLLADHLKAVPLSLNLLAHLERTLLQGSLTRLWGLAQYIVTETHPVFVILQALHFVGFFERAILPFALPVPLFSAPMSA